MKFRIQFTDAAKATLKCLICFSDEDDYFDWRLENDPRFRTAIETSIQQAADGKLTSLRDLRKELAL